MYEQKDKLTSIIFEDHRVDVDAINAYLKHLFSSDESKKTLELLHKDLKSFSYSLQRLPLGVDAIMNAHNSLLATGLIDKEKRTTLKVLLFSKKSPVS
ncbi:hypothetical protein CVT25_007163 [Psilocybe cyanescens]|uniref:Uncharacterized protein n=1 Tax=Psilocybe cyanescens TaxID=93625 RepID=A0A409WVI9_PSICY|nr:hypothetical protein CVT25_007163 [Psilocybe cyanescens]